MLKRRVTPPPNTKDEPQPVRDRAPVDPAPAPEKPLARKGIFGEFTSEVDRSLGWEKTQ